MGSYSAGVAAAPASGPFHTGVSLRDSEMSTEATYLVAPNLNNNYKSIERETAVPSGVKGSKPSFRKCLSPSELKAFIDDPVWIAFRITVLVLLIITFAALLCLAIWICYSEYVYNCQPHSTPTRKPQYIVEALMRTTKPGNNTEEGESGPV